VSQYTSKFLNPIKYINLKVRIHEKNKKEFKKKDKKIIKKDKKNENKFSPKKTNKKKFKKKNDVRFIPSYFNALI
jgi:hypothetical protein